MIYPVVRAGMFLWILMGVFSAYLFAYPSNLPGVISDFTSLYSVNLNGFWYLFFGLTALVPLYTIIQCSILNLYQSFQLKKARRRNGLSRLTWRQFEHMSAAYFRSQGHRAVVVGGKGQGDGGIDVIATKAGRKTIVQCKHWRKRIPVQVVREMYGVMHHEKAGKVAIISSNGFTSEAIKWAKGKPIDLINAAEIFRA